MTDELNNIASLDELDDFDVAEDEPDVRGWNVLGSDGRRLGEVDQLLVDTAAMKVRYLDVDVDDELLEEADEDRHVLIPIGYARLDEDENNVIVDGLSSTDVKGLPEYTHEPITREYESTIRQRFEPGTTTTGTADTTGAAGTTGTTGTTKGFYEHEMYDPDRFYKR